MIGRYGDASALRRALEDRLRHQASVEGVALDRLRKEAAFSRLLARFIAASSEAWVLKGGVSLIWRTGVHVRATKDVDTNWRQDADHLADFLESVEDSDSDDGFAFVVGDGRSPRGEGEGGGMRFPVRVLLAGRDFERFPLDVNVVPGDPRPVEAVPVIRNPLAFAGFQPLTVPMLPVAQQLAEKLHACMRTYADGTSSRAKDGFDIVVIASLVALPSAATVLEAVRTTFALRGTPVPTEPPRLPLVWRHVLTDLLSDYPLRGVGSDPDQLVDCFNGFWSPLLAGEASGRWVVERWSWEVVGGAAG